MVAIDAPISESPVTGEWMELGACRGRTDLYFPPRAERPAARVRREAQARRICASCPVLDACRAYARQHREYGFWGGESEEERHLAGYTVPAPIGVRARSTPAALIRQLPRAPGVR